MSDNLGKENRSSGFSHGLLLGALVGGAAVFFLGTEKGKKLLKVITEEGLERISQFENSVEEEMEEELADDIDMVVEEPTVHPKPAEHHHPKHSSPVRRFFKKSTKK